MLRGALWARTYGKSIFLRTYGEAVRAFMSDRFTHIDNADVLGILKEYLHSPKNGGRYTLVRPYIGRHELNVRVMIRSIVPQGGDSPYGLGCVIRTGRGPWYHGGGQGQVRGGARENKPDPEIETTCPYG